MWEPLQGERTSMTSALLGSCCTNFVRIYSHSSIGCLVLSRLKSCISPVSEYISSTNQTLRKSRYFRTFPPREMLYRSMRSTRDTHLQMMQCSALYLLALSLRSTMYLAPKRIPCRLARQSLRFCSAEEHTFDLEKVGDLHDSRWPQDSPTSPRRSVSAVIILVDSCRNANFGTCYVQNPGRALWFFYKNFSFFLFPYCIASR